MAKFCSECGSELQEGQACSCQELASAAEEPVVQVEEESTQEEVVVQEETVAPAQEEAVAQETKVAAAPATPKEPSGFSKFFNEAINVFKAFFKEPVATTIKGTKKEAWQSGLMLLVANILVLAIASATITARIYSMGLGSISKLLGVRRVGGFALWIITFFTTILAKALLYGALAGLVYLGIKLIVKKELSFLKILSALSVATIPLTLLGLAAFIIGIVGPSFANRIMSAGNLLFMILFYLGVNEVTDADRDMSFYAIAASLFVYSILTAIV